MDVLSGIFLLILDNGGLPLPRPLGGGGAKLDWVVASVSVNEWPREARICDRVEVIVCCDMEAL